MSTTVLLTGVLPFIVLVASVLAVPVSLVLLRLYRNAVQKGMRNLGAGTVSLPERAVVHRMPSSSLQIRTFNHTSSQVRPDKISPAYRMAMQRPWQAAAVYAAAGACYALIMTVGWLVATGDKAVVWTKVLFLFWEYLWPTVIAVVLVAAYDRTRRQQLFATYFFVLFALIGIAVARNPHVGVGQLFLAWIIANGPSTVLVVAFLLRPIRAVGPLVLAFLITVSIGSQTLLSMASANEGLLRIIVDIGFRLGLNATAVFISMILFGMVVFGLLGWPLLSFLGKLYEQKKLSDQSIMLDALWFVFGVVQSIGLAFEATPWILTGLVAFVGYKLVSRLGFRWIDAARRASESQTLLLLRVFALGKRSERLKEKRISF